MSLRAAKVGPIVGHTTDISARIWVRADSQTDTSIGLDSGIRTIGVIAVISKDGEELYPKPCYYFRLKREFDRSGTINLGSDQGTDTLVPDSRYVVRVGTLLLDDPIDDDEGVEWQYLQTRLPGPEAWLDDLLNLPPEKSEANFRTFPSADSDWSQLDFLLGSCRYPGLFWKTRDSDRIFAPKASTVHISDRRLPKLPMEPWATYFRKAPLLLF